MLSADTYIHAYIYIERQRERESVCVRWMDSRVKDVDLAALVDGGNADGPGDGGLRGRGGDGGEQGDEVLDGGHYGSDWTGQ